MKIHFVEICFDSFQAKEILQGARVDPNPHKITLLFI